MMIDTMLRHFVKDDPGQNSFIYRYHVNRFASIVGILCNVMLFAVKFLTGLAVRSISITADSFNNLSDASSNIISLIGAKLASRPADREHPFGHGRYEYLAALIVAIVIIEVGISIFRASLGKIRHPEVTAFSWAAVVLLVLSVLIKLWMAHFYRTVGRKIDSTLLTATAADSRNDVLVTSATIAVLLIEHFVPVHIDGWAGLAVSLFVIWSGFGIAKDTMLPLIGEREDPDLAGRIRKIVLRQKGIIGVHDLIIHNYGPDRNMAQIHAEVPASMSLEEAHTIADQAERDVRDRLGVQTTIHIDPVETDDARTKTARGQLKSVLRSLDSRLTFHDFRIVMGNYHINLVFDLVVPYEYSDEQREQLVYEVQSRMRAASPRYHCHIHCETAF